MELSHVAVDAWLACSGIIALIGVDAFLPGAREPPPENYEACDDEAAETADGYSPDWCHCCYGFYMGLVLGIDLGCGAKRRGAEFDAELKNGVWRWRVRPSRELGSFPCLVLG
jgi:hypothetical protein